MPEETGNLTDIETRVMRLFALVSEALAGATFALLAGEMAAGKAIVDADQVIDDLTDELGELVWERIESGTVRKGELRELVTLLLMVPELERSADLAEHIARRAANNLGPEMSPASRGYVQRMSEVASEMWQTVALAYEQKSSEHAVLDELDEEIDILHDRLTLEIETGGMTTVVAAEVTLIARFYERLGDHAVNLARRISACSSS